ncbi:MAG: glycosyltransferase family 39 protein [Candidatus Paceibacterota bacterium]
MKKNSLLWLILLFALLLRLPLLNGSFWLDEAAQALESVRPLSQQLDIVPDFQPPLMHLLVHFAAQVSTGEWWLRLWGALIPGLVTIWATFKLGEKLFNKQVAIVASLLLATSSLHVFYSQELRPYSLPAMWAMLSTLILFKKDFSWWKFAGVTILGLYSSYLYPFFLIPQLWLIGKKKGWGQAGKILLVSGVAFAPWLPTFFKQLAVGQALRTAIPGWEAVVSIPQLKALVLVPLKFIYGVLDLQLTPTFIISGLAFGLITALAWRNYQNNKQQLSSLKSCLLIGLMPLLSSWLISFAVPVIQPKRLLFLLPFFYLLIAAPLANKKTPFKIAVMPVVFLLAINLISLATYWTQPELQRENWRGLKQEIIQKFPAGQTVAVFSFDESFAPWRWYDPESIASLTTGQKNINQVEDLTGQLKSVTDYQYVLVFDYLRDLTDPTDLLPATVESLGFSGRGVIDYPGIGFVRIYSQPSSAIGYKL